MTLPHVIALESVHDRNTLTVHIELNTSHWKQEHLESADLHQGSSIRINPNIFFMDPDSDPDHSQNLITCSLSHLGQILKISSKSSKTF